MGISKPGAADRLDLHPNFEMPPLPDRIDDPELFMAGARWGAECAAAFLSPPKVPGEDVELRCQDVATAFRGRLVEMMRRRLGL